MSKIREKNDFIADIIFLTWLYHREKTELVPDTESPSVLMQFGKEATFY